MNRLNPTEVVTHIEHIDNMTKQYQQRLGGENRICEKYAAHPRC